MGPSPLTPRDSAAAPTTVRYVVLAWLCLAATIAYVHRGFLGVAEKTVRGELGLSEKQMGLVLGAFFLTYALFQVPSAQLCQAWGTRRALPVFAALWSAAAGLAGLATGFVPLLATRLAMGAGQAGVYVCAPRTPPRTTTPARRG